MKPSQREAIKQARLYIQKAQSEEDPRTEFYQQMEEVVKDIEALLGY